MRYANTTTILRRLLFTVTLIILMITFFSIKAYGNETCSLEEHNVEETAYRHELKAVLADFHEKNAGITLKKVSEDGVNVEYIVDIHVKENEELKKALEAVRLNVENATVTIKLSES